MIVNSLSTTYLIINLFLFTIITTTCAYTSYVIKTIESDELREGEAITLSEGPPFPRYTPSLPSRDGSCSLDRLRKIMHKSMTDNVKETKQNIHTNIGNMDGGSWAIICAECNFSYMAHAQEYCIHSRYNITCLVFRQD